MKQLDYAVVTNKSIMETKLYLLSLAKGRLQQDIHDIVNSSIDNQTLQRNIYKRKDITLFIFSSIKKTLDQVTRIEDFEEHLVYLNILIDKHYRPMLLYKYNLFQTITKVSDFTPEIYCIIRHLIQWKKKQIPDFIEYMATKQCFSKEQYHSVATAIYCIEGQYKLAYKHLSYIEFDYRLEPYRQRLYYYSIYKYYKIIERHSTKIGVPVFSK